MTSSPKDVVRAWVEAFNTADSDRLADFYHEDATNHQVAYDPVVGRATIRDFFEMAFARSEMHCRIETLF